jgi:hypothetical protein
MSYIFFSGFVVFRNVFSKLFILSTTKQENVDNPFQMHARCKNNLLKRVGVVFLLLFANGQMPTLSRQFFLIKKQNDQHEKTSKNAHCFVAITIFFVCTGQELLE